MNIFVGIVRRVRWVTSSWLNYKFERRVGHGLFSLGWQYSVQVAVKK